MATLSANGTAAIFLSDGALLVHLLGKCRFLGQPCMVHATGKRVFFKAIVSGGSGGLKNDKKSNKMRLGRVHGEKFFSVLVCVGERTKRAQLVSHSASYVHDGDEEQASVT